MRAGLPTAVLLLPAAATSSAPLAVAYMPVAVEMGSAAMRTTAMRTEVANTLVQAGIIGTPAADQYLAIVESAPAEVAKPGTITVQAHTLYDIARKLPEGSQVGLDGGSDAKSGQVSLRAGRSNFTLASLDRKSTRLNSSH